MSLTENGNMYMPVAPAYGNNSGFGGFGFGGDGAWLILFILLACMGGWGNGFGGGFGGGRYSRADEKEKLMEKMDEIQRKIETM